MLSPTENFQFSHDGHELSSPPTENLLVKALERHTHQTLGSCVSQLVLGVDMLDANGSVKFDKWPEEVPLCQVAASPGCGALLIGEDEGAVVVLKHSAGDSGRSSVQQVESCQNFDQHASHWNQDFH